MLLERKECGLEVKFASDSAPGEFEGYGAVFGNTDQCGDQIRKGAFKKTLSEWKTKKKLPKMLLQHGGAFSDGMLPIGVWTSMEEDDYGLKCAGRLYGLDTDRGKLIHEGLKNATLDGLSIGYRAVDVEFGREASRDCEPRRVIKEAKLFEVSVVLFGMNERALISNVKSALDFTAQDWRELEAALRDEGLSRADAVKAVSGLKNWFQRDAGAPEQAPRDEAASVALRSLAERIKALSA